MNFFLNLDDPFSPQELFAQLHVLFLQFGQFSGRRVFIGRFSTAAEQSLMDNFSTLFPHPRKSKINSIAEVLMRIAA